jgi:hypothetical protein
LIVVRCAEKLTDALAAATAAGAAAAAPWRPERDAPAPARLRPDAARAALRGLRPALLDLLQLAPPEVSFAAGAGAGGGASSSPPQLQHAGAAAALLAALGATSAPFSREYVAAVLRDADAALAASDGHGDGHGGPGAVDPACRGAGALSWLERYLQAPPGSMLRAALVTAAQEAPLAVRPRAAPARARMRLLLR